MHTDLTDASVHVAPEEVTYPSPEEIAVRAYALFEERGSTDGHDLEDWVEAERQLLLERSHQVASDDMA